MLTEPLGHESGLVVTVVNVVELEPTVYTRCCLMQLILFSVFQALCHHRSKFGCMSRFLKARICIVIFKQFLFVVYFCLNYHSIF